MTTASIFCLDVRSRPKEAFTSESAARKALRDKRRFRNRRYPTTYQCPTCRRWHLTHGIGR